MDRIVEQAGRTFGYVHLGQGESFNPPFGAQPFVCLVWDADGRWDASARQHLANAIIAANCRYVVCGGEHCEAWHDAMDEAFLALGLEEADYDERFVMTSWHAGENEADVAMFFVHCTYSEDEPFTKYLALQVGGGWETMNRLKTAVQEQVGEDEDIEDEDEGSSQEDV